MADPAAPPAVLLDTHLLLWLAQDSPRLPGPVSRLADDAGARLLYSAASIWEVAIKTGLGRADFRADPARLRQGLLLNGYEELPVTGSHAAAVTELDDHHRDPFDRILIAQARVEGLPFWTVDTALAAYGAPVVVVV